MRHEDNRNGGEYEFIVEIGKSELQMLTGFYYNKINLKVGQVLKVDDLYKQLTAFITHEKEIKTLAHTLKTAAGMLEKIDPVFEQKK